VSLPPQSPRRVERTAVLPPATARATVLSDLAVILKTLLRITRV